MLLEVVVVPMSLIKRLLLCKDSIIKALISSRIGCKGALFKTIDFKIEEASEGEAFKTIEEIEVEGVGFK